MVKLKTNKQTSKQTKVQGKHMQLNQNLFQEIPKYRQVENQFFSILNVNINHLRELINMQILTEDLGWSTGFCISNQLSLWSLSSKGEVRGSRSNLGPYHNHLGNLVKLQRPRPLSASKKLGLCDSC